MCSSDLVADNLKQKLSEKIYPIEQKSKRQSAVDKLKNISKIVAGNWKRIGLATTLAGILQFSSDQILEQRNTIAIQEKNQTEVVNKPKYEEELNSLRPKVI